MANHSPFPGFNPWFETVWGTAHHFFISHAHGQISKQLPPAYKARINQDILIELSTESRRVYPDVHVAGSSINTNGSSAIAGSSATPELILLDEGQPHPFIEVVDGETGGKVLCVIEVLSPSNKLDGQLLYHNKQEDLRAAAVNLIEIDWIRAGRPTTVAARQKGARLTGSSPHVSVFRASHPTTAELYRLSLRSVLPTVRVPIDETTNCQLDLKALCDSVSESLALQIDEYSRPLDPPLEQEDARWASDQIRAWAGLA